MKGSETVTVISHRTEAARGEGTPWKMVAGMIERRELIRQFTWREAQARYRGSYLGMVWALITPLLMLAAFTLVFSVILKARWRGSAPESVIDFALTLFSGMIAFNVFSDAASRSPGLIIGYPNYVKKVVFPLEILPVSVLGSAVIHSGLSLIIALTAILLTTGSLPWTIVYLPIVYLPLVLLTLGTSWILAALGVFVRDIGNLIGVALQLLFFLTPISYPLSAVPAAARPWFALNPMAVVVENFRRVLVWGLPPDWAPFLAVTLFSAVVMFAGYHWFVRLKRAFADVV
jgi:lipopolysaccharide transport system permease protein